MVIHEHPPREDAQNLDGLRHHYNMAQWMVHIQKLRWEAVLHHQEKAMLTRKELKIEMDWYLSRDLKHAAHICSDALAKHDALLEIYHLLGGEGEPKDVVEAVKPLFAHFLRYRFQPIRKEEGVVKIRGDNP